MSENLFAAEVLAHETVSPRNPTAASNPPLQWRLKRLVDAYRAQGYRCANVDPLALVPTPHVPELTLEFHGLGPDTPRDPQPGDLPGAHTAAALQQQLSRLYCGALALDCSAVRSETRRCWLRSSRCRSFWRR